MNNVYDPNHIPIHSACNSNYEGMVALVGADELVYLGKSENYHFHDAPERNAYYDNSDGSLQFVSDNVTMYHFLYSEGWAMHQNEMLKEHCFHKHDYMEFARLRDGALSRYPIIREITFAGKPFIPPKAYNRGRRSTRRPVR